MSIEKPDSATLQQRQEKREHELSAVKREEATDSRLLKLAKEALMEPLADTLLPSLLPAFPSDEDSKSKILAKFVDWKMTYLVDLLFVRPENVRSACQSQENMNLVEVFLKDKLGAEIGSGLRLPLFRVQEERDGSFPSLRFPKQTEGTVSKILDTVLVATDKVRREKEINANIGTSIETFMKSFKNKKRLKFFPEELKMGLSDATVLSVSEEIVYSKKINSLVVSYENAKGGALIGVLTAEYEAIDKQLVSEINKIVSRTLGLNM